MVQKYENLVDLEKCFPMSIWLQRLASIQKRTSLSKFAKISPKVRKKVRINIGLNWEEWRQRSRNITERVIHGQGKRPAQIFCHSRRTSLPSTWRRTWGSASAHSTRPSTRSTAWWRTGRSPAERPARKAERTAACAVLNKKGRPTGEYGSSEELVHVRNRLESRLYRGCN